MTPDAALAQITAHGDADRAAQARAAHKSRRVHLGVAIPVLTDLTRGWRQHLDLDARLALADGLWRSDIFDARIAAAKLLTQARIRPDDAVWDLIAAWVPQCDGPAIADAVCVAGQKRVQADPARVAQVADWTTSDHMWTRRAALVITLPWTKQNFPKPAEIAVREQVLGWAGTYVTDHRWYIQKAVAWWVRDLGKHDTARARAFLAEHGAAMKPFAAHEAARHLPERNAAD